MPTHANIYKIVSTIVDDPFEWFCREDGSDMSLDEGEQILNALLAEGYKASSPVKGNGAYIMIPSKVDPTCGVSIDFTDPDDTEDAWVRFYNKDTIHYK